MGNLRVFFLFIVCVVALLGPGPAGAGSPPSAPSSTWTSAWATALQAIPEPADPPPLYRRPEVAGRTVRQIVYPTVGGSQVRLHFSNRYGRSPLVLLDARIARAADPAMARVLEGLPVTFGGRSALTLAPGAETDSDPVELSVVRGAPYAVSMYLGAQQQVDAWHRVTSQVNFISTAGNHAADTSGAAFSTRITHSLWLTSVSVATPAAGASVAAIGDSITDGMNSSLNKNRRWPDAAARRVAEAGGDATAVINLGISGNRLLSDSPCYGEALVKRFGRDLQGKAGVKTAVVLVGINDINFAAMAPRPGLDCDFPHTAVSADDLVQGYRRLIASGREAGIRIFLATLTPASLPPSREELRAAVNHWIRTAGAADGVVDFDAALRDPEAPVRLRPAYDSGDHIHPSDAGYAAMADAVPAAALLLPNHSSRP